MSERMSDRQWLLCKKEFSQPWRWAKEADRARASEDAKDKEIERLKADNAGLLVLLTTAERTWSASHDLNDAAHHASMMALRKALTTQLHNGTAILKELTRLRAQVAALTKRTPGVEP